MSARPTAHQHRTAYKLFLMNCLSPEWLSCLVCFRKHQVAIQRLTLSTLYSQTLMEVEFFMHSTSSDSPFEKNPILKELDSLLKGMQQCNWLLEPLVNSPLE